MFEQSLIESSNKKPGTRRGAATVLSFCDPGRDYRHPRAAAVIVRASFADAHAAYGTGGPSATTSTSAASSGSRRSETAGG